MFSNIPDTIDRRTLTSSRSVSATDDRRNKISVRSQIHGFIFRMCQYKSTSRYSDSDGDGSNVRRPILRFAELIEKYLCKGFIKNIEIHQSRAASAHFMARVAYSVTLLLFTVKFVEYEWWGLWSPYRSCMYHLTFSRLFAWLIYH